MNSIEAMKIRKSMRTYEEMSLERESKEKLINYLKEVSAPFGEKMRFALVEKNEIKAGAKLGTYGIIKGAETYLCAIVEKEPRYEENLGYAFEKIILYATAMGLGTCWLGGTFKRSDFESALALKDSELIPIVAPVGYTKQNRSLIDTLMVAGAGSKKRKSFQELFFNGSLEQPLKLEDTDGYREAFEMVRIAPSASNKQPWRIVKEENTFHFYLCRNKNYAKSLAFDIQRLDIGIAMCHFELALKELGCLGKWTDEKQSSQGKENVEYIISYSIEEEK